MVTCEKNLSLCKERIIPKWNSTPDSFPLFLKRYSPEEQEINAIVYKEIKQPLCVAMPNLLKNNSRKFVDSFTEKIAEFIKHERILCIKDHISPELWNEFENSIVLFFDRIKQTYSRITSSGAWQALRNYIIYRVIVNMQGSPLSCSDPILGFSLLYPCTDNYIDTMLNTPKRKAASHLLDTMLKAQENSMRQEKSVLSKPLTPEQILEISAFKGGTSVLIDYLIAIDLETDGLPDSEIEFYTSLGLILQFTDDLQDIGDDSLNNMQTLYTISSDTSGVERTTNRLLNFAYGCLTEYSTANGEIYDFVIRCCVLAITIAVATSSKFFRRTI